MRERAHSCGCGRGVVGDTGEDPADVAIDGGLDTVEGDARDRAGGVVADARKRPERVGLARQRACVTLSYDARRPL